MNFSVRISCFSILEMIQNVSDFSNLEAMNSTAASQESNSQVKCIPKERNVTLRTENKSDLYWEVIYKNYLLTN